MDPDVDAPPECDTEEKGRGWTDIWLDVVGVAVTGVEVMLDGKQGGRGSVGDGAGDSCRMEVAGADVVSSVFKGAMGGSIGDDGVNAVSSVFKGATRESQWVMIPPILVEPKWWGNAHCHSCSGASGHP